MYSVYNNKLASADFFLPGLDNENFGAVFKI